ncbi:Hypothetical protein PHPALM_36654 [Phytophthora palmivora]|uniref:Uncharacterized protein n=1 Tax=Phytophthora palmivora TaxID=4796 RepID=A0A2P4WZD9_9STRA|nr:Hypothetical protein PHPALM_36654 [Phytophthora palmivora]
MESIDAQPPLPDPSMLGHAMRLGGTDINLLNATSLTRSAFHKLLRRFVLLLHPSSTGERLSAQTSLSSLSNGACLVILHGSGSLSMMLAVRQCTCIGEDAKTSGGCSIKRAKQLLPCWPSPTRQNKIAKLLEAREHLLKHTFEFIDGKTSSETNNAFVTYTHNANVCYCAGPSTFKSRSAK